MDAGRPPIWRAEWTEISPPGSAPDVRYLFGFNHIPVFESDHQTNRYDGPLWWAIADAMPEDVRCAYATLGCAPDVDDVELKHTYRQRAHVLHPDHGGDSVTMAALSQAYERVKEWRACHV